MTMVGAGLVGLLVGIGALVLERGRAWWFGLALGVAFTAAVLVLWWATSLEVDAVWAAMMGFAVVSIAQGARGSLRVRGDGRAEPR